jgi:uncharacterized protein (TIGR03083 family)
VAQDYAAVIGSESARLVAALDGRRTAVIPWSERWTVEEVAQHVGSIHHVVAKVIAGRPVADFGAFATLSPPSASDPALGRWVTEGTSALVAQVRSTDPDEACWSWWPDGGTAAFWARRMANETLVHRWDAELGAGVESEPMDPATAADAVDEFLDVFVAVTRRRHSAPGGGETAHLHCTDTEGEWLLVFPSEGERELRREHAKGDVAFRGPAEGLLQLVWGRKSADDAGVEVIGDPAVAERWTQLVPPV